MYKDEFLYSSKILILIVYEECETIVNNTYYMLWSVLLVEETRRPGENLSQVTDKLYHIMLYTSP
jgi:hypothetical protein